MQGSLVTTVALTALVSLPAAQFDNQWVSYSKDNAHLGPTPLELSNRTTSLPGDTPGTGLVGTETDVAWGDLNKDGWTDLVLVRKQPFTSAGKRTNVLLMNEGGVLTDRTATLASASDVPGDQGFLTATNDRDVMLADFDGDTWLDLVTATTLSDGDPKAVGHPRIYMNLGNDAAGNWLGLEYQEARIPQLLSYSTGNPTNPRFCSVGVGDVTGDGRPDLYFGDYDSSGAGGVFQPAGFDMNDRLLINDGTGFFTDESTTRMTEQMLVSAFGVASVIADMNGDGVGDVVKDTALNAPTDVRVIYNDPSNEGNFNINDVFHSGFSPYHTNTGDINGDGRLDVIISDDGLDRYRLNTGNDILGRVIWGPAKTFSYLSGGDDGFGSNNLIADLDGDGRNDALIADVDVDIGGYNRRLHIYHNVGDLLDPTYLEERQSAGAGWIGVVGMTQGDLGGTHDVAVFDVDNDSDVDMVVSRGEGTDVWTQDGGLWCQTSIGYGGPGFSKLTVCGSQLTIGNSASVSLTDAPASQPVIFAFSLASNPTAIFGGLVVTNPLLTTVPALTDGTGSFIATDAFTGTGNPATFYLQALTLDPNAPQLWDISNAIQIEIQ